MWNISNYIIYSEIEVNFKMYRWYFYSKIFYFVRYFIVSNNDFKFEFYIYIFNIVIVLKLCF